MAENTPTLPPDFVDLPAVFGHAEVRYLVIGGYAVGFHDRPRTTKDLDILLDPQPDDIERACRALLEFGAHLDIANHLATAVEDEVVWMEHPPLRVDFLKHAPGVTFTDAWARRVVSTWGSVAVNVIARAT